ncbi:hypothetical protein PCI56_03255 [Plesiomonas shigelloides subsp. oncorhynchi]|nr:hypothetical protein [Plesiomonas shigelloides]
MMADLSRSWSIPELAQACHMSEATLRRKATQEVGSLVNFIHEIKMLEALRLYGKARCQSPRSPAT